MADFEAMDFVTGLVCGIGIYFVAIIAGQAGLFNYFGAALPGYISNPPTWPKFF
jgi:hypothetical protein